MPTRSFHLGDLLSITTGRLVSPDHIDGVWMLIDYVTGVTHMTHQLPRATLVVRGWLLRDRPWLAEIEVPEFTGRDLVQEAQVWSWLAKQVALYGERHKVKAMPPGTYQGRDPLIELEEMMGGPERIITVHLED